MIVADTTRSRGYIQGLVRNNLLPNHVFILDDKSEQIMPGQSAVSLEIPIIKKSDNSVVYWHEDYFDPNESIRKTLKRAQIEFQELETKNINDEIVVELIRKRTESVFIYSGFGGVLLKDNILNIGKKILHVHGGYLPDYKGSTTNYYSLISENYIAASSLFLNKKIDSGSILFRRKFKPPPDCEGIDHIYDTIARVIVLIETLESFIKCNEWKSEISEDVNGETYYIIHPVLKHLAILNNTINQ